MKDLDDVMKQAQQLQGKVAQLQQQIAAAEVVGESGAGMVKVVMTGRHEVRKVTIDPDLLGEDKEILEDLLAAAVNDAAHKIDTKNRDMMGSLTAGMPLPPGFKLPF
ncbi:MAG: YbaB/EbfC family nucleoid-associated protein [Porticoccaceae bacterium]